MNRALLLLIIALSMPSKAIFGWHDAGHQTVASIAYDHLRADVKAKVDEWIATATLSFPHHQTFVTSSVLFDNLKEQGIRAFDTWHFAIMPYDPTGYLNDCRREKVCHSLDGRDVVFAIGQAIHTLKDKSATPYAKGFMLTLLIHTVADIHQPMHVTSLYSEKFPQGDLGGNKFLITYQGKSTSLHFFFDDIGGMGCSTHYPPTEKESAYLAQLKETILSEFPKSKLEAVSILEPKEWKRESYELGVEARAPLTFGQTLTDEYATWAKTKTKERIALAGYRLAHLLNNIVK